jgi:hypothetical protein
MYTDGELTARKARQIQKHLHACWRCRVELQRIGQAIEEFMECRNAEAGQSPPLRGWSQFSRLLRSAGAEQEDARPFLSGFGRRPRLRFAAAGAMAVAVVLLWVHLRSIPTVSASTLLDRAVNAEIQTARGMSGDVVYQRIAFRRKPSSRLAGQAGEVEAWSDLDLSRYRQRSSAPAWPELEHVLQRNHMGGRRLLSAAAFSQWRNSLTRRQESVYSTKLADGSEALALRTVASEAPQPDSILEASLIVHAGDWRAVQQDLRVQGESDIWEYELSEINYAVIPRSSLDASIFGTPPPTLPPLPTTVPAPALISRSEKESMPIESEIQALYALHQVRACLGDDVQVTRSVAGQVIVRGVVETQQRKEQLQAVLQPVHGVKVQIETIAESQSAAVPAAPASTVELPGKVSIAERHAAPIQDALKGRLSANRIVALSYRAVSLSEDWVAEAWALRHLAEAVSAEDLANLTKSSQEMLAEMVRDHTASLRAKVSECRTEFEPYLSNEAFDLEPEAREVDWPGSARQVFAAATNAADLARSLCAGPGPLNAPPTDAIRNLVASLRDTESDATHLETAIAALLESRAEAVQAKSTKNK